MEYCIFDPVMKCTGDYNLPGIIVSIFHTTAGRERFVVEHKPGFLHIYSASNIRPLTPEEVEEYDLAS